MSNPLPKLTTDQRRANLDKAATIRKERAIIRNDLKHSLMTFEQVLKLADAGCHAAANLRVKQAINAMPGYSFSKTQQLMKQLHIAESRRIKGLGVNQRAALVDVFGGAK